MYRSDLSSRISHLTKRSGEKRALENLFSILNTKEIRGSGKEGYIIGNNTAVCFMDIPLQSLAETVQYENKVLQNAQIKYEGFGLRFNKGTLFQKYLGRPVIYGPSEELKQLIKEDEYWRIVNLDYSNSTEIIDWTHEREWRVKGSVHFEYKDVEVIVYSAESYTEFIKYYRETNPELLEEIQGIIVLESLLK